MGIIRDNSEKVGSGKSLIAEKIAKIQNISIIDTDQIVRKCQEKGEEYYKEIVKKFGKEILEEGTKEINRKKLANIVFNDKTQKEKLDKITMEYIIPKIKQQAESKKNVIIDAPLLFETELDKICDISIGIIAKEETCIKRICKRDKIEENEAKARLKNQQKIDYYKIKCDYIIDNETNAEKQIEEIFEKNKNLSNSEIIHIYDEDIEYLQFRKLLKYSEKIQHCFTLKPLDLNLENRGKAIADYEKICKSLNLEIKNIYRPKQTHSTNIEKIDVQEAGIYKIQDTDGLITNRQSKILSLTYADCTPLYFYDPVKNIIRKRTLRLERNIWKDCKICNRKIEKRI